MQKMISQSLDNLAFVMANTRPKDDFLQKCLVIDQQNCVSPENAKWLRCQATMGAVAIVDRTADVAAAAKAIAMSTLLFAGKGNYAPNCILVNEFVEENFSQLFEQYASATARSDLGSNRGHKGGVNGDVHKTPPASKDTRLTTLINR
jgi:hypothetical protein